MYETNVTSGHGMERMEESMEDARDIKVALAA
jgi:hypothetical protein